MKERPILFSAPMVRALLNGSKTQTRRAVKTQPCILGEEFAGPRKSDGFSRAYLMHRAFDRESMTSVCPYGQARDQLWVRETFADLTATHGQRWEKFNVDTKLYERGVKPFAWYRADGEQPDPGNGTPLSEPWRPSIFMPRWASRITIEITGVRVERLHDISETDALAEGVKPLQHPGAVFTPCKSAYCDLWESINGDGSWATNPWVWAVEFKRVTQ